MNECALTLHSFPSLFYQTFWPFHILLSATKLNQHDNHNREWNTRTGQPISLSLHKLENNLILRTYLLLLLLFLFWWKFNLLLILLFLYFCFRNLITNITTNYYWLFFILHCLFSVFRSHLSFNSILSMLFCNMSSNPTNPYGWQILLYFCWAFISWCCDRFCLRERERERERKREILFLHMCHALIYHHFFSFRFPSRFSFLLSWCLSLLTADCIKNLASHWHWSSNTSLDLTR